MCLSLSLCEVSSRLGSGSAVWAEMSMCPFRCIMMSVCLNVSDENLSHLVRVVLAWFLHCKFIIFLFVTNKENCGETFLRL